MEFIEEMLLKGLSPSERLKVVTSTKFRGQWLTLRSNTLKTSKSAVYDWGSDMGLSRMPKHSQHTLAYALAAHRKQERIAA
ncbi:MAG: hypothetical protein AAFW70_22675 [Cyanobacteria bacterium J06635_10]